MVGRNSSDIFVFPKRSRQPSSSSLSSLFRNSEKILGYLNSNVISHDLIPQHVNFSQMTVTDYSELYGVIKTVKEGGFADLGLDQCLLEDELNKVSPPPSPSVSVSLTSDQRRPINGV